MLKYHIQTIELSSTSPAITFSNIPQIYDDLELVVSSRFAGTRSSYGYRFNGDSSSAYPWRRLYGTGSSAVSSSGTGTTGLIGECPGTAETTNTFGSGKLYIPNYTSNSVKSASADDVSENNATEAYQHIVANVWNGTAPISSLSIMAYGGPSTNFAVGSSASLYGIKRGADGVTNGAATGGTITTFGGFTIHTFTSSGTFTANRNLNVEYLVIAGGGGGASGADRVGGGGGAGGYRSSVSGEFSGSNNPAEPTVVVNAGTSYSVVIGAGGAAGSTSGTYVGNPGSNGSSSSFGLITSVGGGGGGASGTSAVTYSSPKGGTGGSGGGGQGYGYDGTGNNFGDPIDGQGFMGGNGFASTTVGSPQASGGGGGAGGFGRTATNAVAGNGGNGITSSITGTAVTRAGGGGGTSRTGTVGTGGNGGGGAGARGSNGVSGTANTGGGGGAGNVEGTGVLQSGGAGGSGIVIIRYRTPA